jgi:tetraprenyl-beta-curcumene synthase
MGLDGGRQAGEFARASKRYWLDIFPIVRREVSHWRRQAASIPTESLRDHALDTHRVKRNPEGAAAFAVLAPRANRHQVTRMLVAYQTMFDYVDTVSEEPGADDPLADARQLHRALGASVAPDPPRHDYYDLHAHKNDGGYMAAQVTLAQEILTSLPSYPLVEEAIRRSAARCEESQSQMNVTGAASARTTDLGVETAFGDGLALSWWEISAAETSSLSVLALMAVAADPTLNQADVRSIELAYHPWIAGLSTMLDSLVDLEEDLAGGLARQVDRYQSVEDAAQRLSLIASHAFAAAAELPQGGMHTAIMTGMAAYYLAAQEVWNPRSEPISQGILDALGPLMKPAIVVHRIRQRDPIFYPPLPSLGAGVR